ncbi:MAG: D-alanine--D-alanine ligase family protein [Acidimicrobiales bacterium]
MSPVPTGTVGVVFGGPSPEHDVSILTGLQAARALLMAGMARSSVEAIYWTKGERFMAVAPDLEASAFLEGPPKGARELRLVASPGGGFFGPRGGVMGGGKERRLEVDVVVNCCHGGPGEDGTLQAALDMAGISYTGPGAAGAALGMDKLAFGALVEAAGLPSLPRGLVLPGSEAPRNEAFGAPYILKPRFGGSSIGIEVIEDWADVLRYVELGGPHTARGVVAEPFRSGADDVQVAVRAWPALSLSLLERALRSDGSSPILSYADKYLGGEGMLSAPRELPARLPDGLEKELRDAAGEVAALAGVRGVWRLDFLVEVAAGRWWVNEANTIPGSLAKYLWVGEAAVEFADLLADMVEEARRRPSAQWGSAGADGTALRSAAAIASKLG